MATEVIKVPQKRMKIIKEKKEELQNLLSVSLSFDEDSVVINGEADRVYFSLPVIKAIARGFSLEDAKKLILEDYVLEIIDLQDFCNNPNCLKRLKSRIIGRKGKIKMKIQETTNSKISVYGNTVSFISPYYSAKYTKEAIEILLNGGKHSTLLNYLVRVKDKIFYFQLTGKEL